MNLILLFDKVDEDFIYNKNDIFLSSVTQDFIKDNICIIDESIVLNESTLKKFNNFILEISNSPLNLFMKEAIEASKGNFYIHIFSTLERWLLKVEEIINDNPIQSIIFSHYTKSFGYLPLYEAEGEITRKLFYHSYDFLPYYIESYIKLRFNRQVVILKSCNVFSLYFRLFLRRFFVLFGLLFLALKRKISISNSKDFNIVENFGFTSKFLVTRSYGQSDSVYPYINNSNYGILVYDNFSVDSNLEYINSNFDLGKTYNLINLQTYSDIFLTFFQLLFNLIYSYTFCFFNWKYLNGLSLARESLVISYDALLFERVILRFENFINASTKIEIVTCDMYTPFSYYLSRASKKREFLSSQFEATFLNVYSLPDIFWCDQFITKNKYTFESLNKVFSNYKDKFKQFDTVYKKFECINVSEIKSICFCTQPYEKENEYLIVEALYSLCLKSNIEMYIKYHPRELVQYTQFKELKIYNSNISVCNSSNLVDVFFTRTSAISNSLIICGRPIFFSLFSSQDQSYNFGPLNEEYRSDYEVYFYNIDGLTDFFSRPQYFIDNYSKFQKMYLKY